MDQDLATPALAALECYSAGSRRRAEFLDAQLERLDELIAPLVVSCRPAARRFCG